MLDLNRANLSIATINVAINDAVERAAAKAAELPRPYLGASIVGSECLRKVQYDWWCKPVLPARVREIFARGHYFENQSRALLKEAGFKFAPPEVLKFSAVDGLLQGHADGIIIAGPDLPGAYFNYPFLWEHKALNAKNWRALERDGLEKTFPQYAAQVSLYQAYLDATNPALFTAVNSDTCERLHFFVPFSAERAQAWSDRAVTIIEATAPENCCRVATTIRATGIAACVVTPKDVGGEKRLARRGARNDPCGRLRTGRRTQSALESQLDRSAGTTSMPRGGVFAKRPSRPFKLAQCVAEIAGDRAMSSKPVTFEERVAKLFRMLSSNSEGEVAAAAHAIARMMKSASPDKIHAVADRIEKANGDGLNKAEAREVFNAGYAEGVRAAENTHHGVNDFHNADGKPAWEAVALFVQRNKDRLDTRHHEFIDNMASRTVWEDYEPTDRMHKYLHSLFFKLGGKIK